MSFFSSSEDTKNDIGCRDFTPDSTGGAYTTAVPQTC